MPDFVNQQVDTLLRRHLLEMKVERENDSRTTMHTPEQHADLLLGRLRKSQIPQQQFPVKRIAFGPERRPKDASIRLVPRGHKALQMMTGNQLMMNRGA